MEPVTPEHLLNERQELEKLRSELEEKNRLTWEMSETVYREKKKMEAELNKIVQDKTTLEAQKQHNDEQVKLLWEQSTAIHAEKERIDRLKTEIEYRHKEVMDSVNYAKRIQEAILPENSEILDALPESFVMLKPKDIVSGDFFWFEDQRSSSGKIFIAAADCTGHGVPGALMSMLGTDKLNNALLQSQDPSGILSELNRGVKKVLRQNDKGTSTRDGMDIALLAFNSKLTSLEYAAANRPLWLIRSGSPTIEEFKATKTAIGGFTSEDQVFEKHAIELQKGDTVYIFSDGFADQFGANDKKLMSKSFKNVLLEIQGMRMADQKLHLDDFIEKWRGNTEQTDDILVIGIRC
jgi:serine phosphatase RsbU (regulator of sigma subunit)